MIILWQRDNMPVSSSHAYANGKLYGYNKYFSGFRLFGILTTILDFMYAQAAWASFRKNSIMGNSCFLGAHSWCTNLGKRENIRIGNNVYCRGLLKCGTRGSGSIIIGDEVYIGDDTIISSENCVEIGNLTLISHGVQIFDTIGHPTDSTSRERDWRIIMGKINEPRPAVSSKPVIIGKRVWIGFNSIIMRGVKIGDNAIVAAGSVVVHDVEQNTLVAGNPARVVKDSFIERQV